MSFVRSNYDSIVSDVKMAIIGSLLFKSIMGEDLLYCFVTNLLYLNLLLIVKASFR
jgi:hypothetical protein